MKSDARAKREGYGGSSKLEQNKFTEYEASYIVCYTAVLSVVTQRSSPQDALRDDTKNGCVAYYELQEGSEDIIPRVEYR